MYLSLSLYIYIVIYIYVYMCICMSTYTNSASTIFHLPSSQVRAAHEASGTASAGARPRHGEGRRAVPQGDGDGSWEIHRRIYRDMGYIEQEMVISW